MRGTLVVISWGMGNGVGSWHLLRLIYVIKQLSLELGISLSHNLRDQNVLGDKLPKWGVGFPSLFSGRDIPESSLQ